MNRSTLTALQPWLSLVVRVAMAVILLVAAIPKFQDLDASVRAVRAYRLLPELITPLVGQMLPFVEVLLAIFLLAGLFTRTASVIWILMMVGFSVGVIWAWAKGYQIDCGCFSSGGDLPEGETASYGPSLALRGLFIAMGAYLWWQPRSRFSVDGWMDPAIDDNVDNVDSADNVDNSQGE